MNRSQNLEKDGAVKFSGNFDTEFKKLEKQCKKFYPKGSLNIHRKRRWYWEIEAKDVIKIADFCFNKLGCRFSIASAEDTPKGFTILYHFSFDKLGVMINLRVTLPHDDPKVDSLTVLGRGFEWIEREMHELLGIEFIGLDDTRHLLLPDDSPAGYYPLRRSFG